MKSWMAILAVVALMGCGKKKGLADKSPLEVNEQDVAKALPSGAGISAKEAEALARDFEKAVIDRDSVRFDQLLDLDELFYRIFPREMVEAQTVLREAMNGWKKGVGMLPQLAQSHYRFLRVMETSVGPIARFRLLPLSGGVNYHDLLLARNKAGKVCVADIYIYSIGEKFSQMQRRMFQQMAPQLLSGKGTRKGVDEEDAQMKKFSMLVNMVQRGQHAAVLRMYNGLAKETKTVKAIMQIRIGAASALAVQRLKKGAEDGKEYVKAIEDFRSVHPEAGNLELLLLDFHFFNKDFKGALAVVNALDKRVGGDPYLDQIRGNIAFKQDNMKKARTLLTKVTETIPELRDPYNLLVEISLDTKDFSETTRLLIAKERNTGENWELNFNGEAVFDGYRASREFAKWKTYKSGK